MSEYIGVVRLEKPIYCSKEVSGKQFSCKIAGCDTIVILPSLPDDYDVTQCDFQNGDLVVPANLFKGKINWGMVHSFPQCIFSVNAFLCYFSIDELKSNTIYEKFPQWKDKFTKLHVINKGNYLQPKEKPIALVRGGGFDDGLQLFELIERKKLNYVINPRPSEAITVHLIDSNESYSFRDVLDLFTYASDDKEIALPYELLMTAFYSMENNDFRSAVILAGTAVEKAILKRIRQEYTIESEFEKDKDKHRMLGGKFRWLSEKGIPIPVTDYKIEIIDRRNDAAHEGKSPTYTETKQCLEKCKTLIETYHPQILE